MSEHVLIHHWIYPNLFFAVKMTLHVGTWHKTSIAYSLTLDLKVGMGEGGGTELHIMKYMLGS